MKKSMNPKRHHYIPVFYLKNFTGSDGHFFVYDKGVNAFPVNARRSPKQVCYEYDRNTLIWEKEDFRHFGLESEVYQYFDSNAANTFRELNQSGIETFQWTDKLVAELEKFIVMLFWRLPVNDWRFEKKIAESKSMRDFGLLTINEETGELVEDQKIHSMLLSDINTQKGLRPTLLFATINKDLPYFIDDLEWRISYWKNGRPRLTSDNPLLFCNEVSDSKDILNALVLPLSSDKSLVKIKKGFNGIVNPYSAFFQDMAIFHLARKYVICSDKKYLGFIADRYNLLARNDLTHRIIPSLFESYGQV